jgi:hypothetical protein
MAAFDSPVCAEMETGSKKTAAMRIANADRISPSMGQAVIIGFRCWRRKQSI